MLVYSLLGNSVHRVAHGTTQFLDIPHLLQIHHHPSIPHPEMLVYQNMWQLPPPQL